MKIVVDEELLNILDRSNIFQKRKGMGRIPESPERRWKVGDVLSFHETTVIEEFTTFASGYTLFTAGSFTGMASTLPVGSQVGRYTEVAAGVKLIGFRHPIESVSINSAVFNFARENVRPYFERYDSGRAEKVKRISVPTPQTNNLPIVVGHDVWIGSDVTISGGVNIGNGAIIAAGSLVTKDVEPYSVAMGIPAQHKKWRFNEEVVNELMNLQWWNWELGDLFHQGLDFSNPRKFIDGFYKNQSKLNRFIPKKFYPFEYLLVSSGVQISKNFLYTAHLTYFVVDINSMRISHISKNRNGPLDPVCLVEMSEGLSLSVGGKFISSISNNGTVSISDSPSFGFVDKDAEGMIAIKMPKGFLSARKEGHVAEVSALREWEKFFPGSYFKDSILI